MKKSFLCTTVLILIVSGCSDSIKHKPAYGNQTNTLEISRQPQAICSASNAVPLERITFNGVRIGDSIALVREKVDYIEDDKAWIGSDQDGDGYLLLDGVVNGFILGSPAITNQFEINKPNDIIRKFGNAESIIQHTSYITYNYP